MSQNSSKGETQTRTNAFIDPLTGAYGESHLKTRFIEELARAEDMQKPLSLVVLDMDDFTKLNEELGEDAGDSALTGVVETLNRCTKPMEIVARIADDKFAVLLPNTSAEEAMAIADRFKKRLKLALAFEYHGLISASMGVETTKRPHKVDADTLMRTAMQALSISKRSGKDRATHASNQ